jgi:hypothetical protein
MKYWKNSIIILGVTPLLWAIFLLIFYFHASIDLGYLPSYSSPDPKYLSFYSFYAPIINFFGALWAYSFLIWLPLLIIHIVIKRRKSLWRHILYSVFAQAIGVTLFCSNILEWFID